MPLEEDKGYAWFSVCMFVCLVSPWAMRDSCFQMILQINTVPPNLLILALELY